VSSSKLIMALLIYRITGRLKLRAFVEQLLSREELLIAAIKSHWTTIIGIPRVSIILRRSVGMSKPRTDV
jgi:hypothetical protein